MNGRYKVDPEPLGQGGMATVHRAEVTSAEGFRRRVALKYIHPDLASQPDFEAQFRAEARALSLLQHPNVVQVLDFDRDVEGRLFLVMELVDGTDLRRVRDFSALPVPLTIHVVAQVLRGLDHAHRAVDEQGRALNLVHRDLSPQNVLVSWDGAVKVTDFGIAQGLSGSTTRTGVVKGNVGYLSPEQIEGNPLDARSDLFAVGIVAHELLLGVPLFARPGLPARSVLAQIALGKAPAPSSVRTEIPDALSRWVMRLLASDRARRPGSAAEALRELLELGFLPPTVELDLVSYLEAVRRTVERPTLIEEDVPADLVPATAPMPSLETVARDTLPLGLPVESLEVETTPRGQWMPALTVVLAVAVVALTYALLAKEPDPLPEPSRRSSLIVELPTEPLGTTEQEVLDAEAQDAGAPNVVDAPRRRTRARRLRKAPSEPAPKSASTVAAPVVDAGTKQRAPDAGPGLLPYEAPPAGGGLLPYTPRAGQKR